MKEIYLAGGQLSGIEKYLSLIPGVVQAQAGVVNAEVAAVQVLYDPERIGLTFLLERFYEAIDPTWPQAHGRAGIYYAAPEEASMIRGSLILLGESLTRPVTVELGLLREYSAAAADSQAGCGVDIALLARAKGAVDEVTMRRSAEKRRLREVLTPMQFEVTQNGATEPCFENAYHANFREGIYVDVTSGEPLFVSSDKFESGCGWPSFSRPIDRGALNEVEDKSFGRSRVEVRTSGSDAHLGHVFEDGPEALGGLRYCINSAALRFVPKEEMEREGYGGFVGLV